MRALLRRAAEEDARRYEMSVHPQVESLLERVARSPLPPYHTVSPFVARRIYRDTRAALAPKAPELPEVRLLALENYAMRIYRPVVGETLPALVYFHGGGWTIGDVDTHDVLCRQLALGARCAVFSVDYRLAPEHPFPAAVEDCFAATRHVAENAGRLNVRGIALGGDSAGGNLAAVVALLARERNGPPIAFQLLIYPATDQRCATPSHGRILADALASQGVRMAFGVPGESYLPVLDGLHDLRERIQFIVCRQEGGASYMAEAYGKLTGEPGVLFVTRGPGATNGAIGVHTGFQDSTPMVVFIGQVPNEFAER